jgi:serine phosphatase RsbU (regulator of sigma subunit)
LREIKGDKFPVGYYDVINQKNFVTHQVPVKKGECLYMLSDGYSDQFGGPKGKKFKSKNTNELLLANWKRPMTEQEEQLKLKHLEWRGDLKQVDDICVVGVRI